MQKKTRFIALFLGLMMLMSLAACQKAPAQEPAQEETQVQEPVQEEPAGVSPLMVSGGIALAAATGIAGWNLQALKRRKEVEDQ